MSANEILQQGVDILKPWTRWTKADQPDLLTISISRRDLIAAVQALLDSHWGYLSAITGLSVQGTLTTSTEEKQWQRTPEESNIHASPQAAGDSFVVLYTFCNGAASLNLRVHPPSLSDTCVPSLCSLIPSATLYERELIEMFGIDVEGTPNREHLLLPDNWPAEVFPLRKSFNGLEGKDTVAG